MSTSLLSSSSSASAAEVAARDWPHAACTATRAWTSAGTTAARWGKRSRRIACTSGGAGASTGTVSHAPVKACRAGPPLPELTCGPYLQMSTVPKCRRTQSHSGAVVRKALL
eukprot:6768771-Pyramimonas_sp.AAC.2